MMRLNYSKPASDWTRAIFNVMVAAAVWGIAVSAYAAPNPYCGSTGVWVQVLGSAGPDLARGRAGASYLIWENSNARVLIDAGAGSAVHFAESGARFSDLAAVLLTNLHPDTWTDLPVLLRRSYYGNRNTALPVLAPAGNEHAGDLKQALAPWYQLDARNIYPAELLASLPEPPVPHSDFRLRLKSVRSVGNSVNSDLFDEGLQAHSAPVNFGIIPAVAWRVSLGGLKIVFIGNAAGPTAQIEAIAKDADVLVMHLNIEEGRRGALKRVALTPSRIGMLAERADARLLLLGHRMGRTFGLETVNRPAIEQHFNGSLKFADDNDCYRMKPKGASR